MKVVRFSWLLLVAGLAKAQDSAMKKGIFEHDDLIDIAKAVFHIPIKRPVKVEGKNVFFSFIPVGDQTGTPGNAFITSTTAAFYAGDRNNSFLSNITFSPYLTFKGRFGYTLRSNIWTTGNKWAVLGDIRFLYYPQYTWGLGGNPDNRNSLLISYKYVRVYQTFLRQIRPYLCRVKLGYKIGIVTIVPYPFNIF